jgi:AcrR family transcriptional regulator
VFATFFVTMGINERRDRERQLRKAAIIEAAWRVATADGWAGFSVERVAVEAELGRATVYGYFASVETLVLELAREALEDLHRRVAAAAGLAEALDVPVRLSQANPAGFALLFPQGHDGRSAFANQELSSLHAEAKTLLARLGRLATRSGATLPEDAQSAAAFIQGVCLAGAVVPELRASTTLRRKWQDFVFGSQLASPKPSSVPPPPAKRSR